MKINSLRDSKKNSLERTFALAFPLFFSTLPFTRQMSGLNLAAFLLVAVLYLVKNYRVVFIPKTLLFFCLIAIGYVVLSFFNLFPAAWTSIYSKDAILQQAFFAFALAPSFLYMAHYVAQRIDNRQSAKRLALVLFLLWVSSKFLGLLAGEIHGVRELLATFGLGSQSALLITSVSIYLAVEASKFKRRMALTLFLASGALSPFSQNYVFAVLFLLIWTFPRRSFQTVSAFLLVVVASYALLLGDPLSVQFIDQNLSVRLALLADALDGFIGSGGVGVGFGTESVKNYYSMFSNSVFFDEDASGFIHISAHNSFATILFRLGFLGFLAILAFGAVTLSACRMPRNPRIQALCCSMFSAFFIVSFLNPAFESYFYLFGVIMYLSLIWSVKRQCSLVRSFSVDAM